MQKPVSFSSPSVVTIIFSGEIPLWIIPALWIMLSVVKSGTNSFFTCSHERKPLFDCKNFLSETPSTYSRIT